MIIDDTNYDPKITLNLEATAEGLTITCGSCTSQKGCLDWNKTYSNSEKMEGLRQAAALKETWESESKKYIINYKGLTDEEIGVVEGE